MTGSRLHPAPVLLLTLNLLLNATAAASDATAPVYDGQVLYALNCANCHGTYGEGDGAMAPDMSVVLLDLRYIAQRNNGTFPRDFVRRIIDGRETRAAHGPTGMPVWGAEFMRGEGVDTAAGARVDAKIEALTDFLAEIQIRE